MYDSIVRGKVIKSVSYCIKDNGWANLAEVGSELKKNGILYNKLTEFLAHFDDILEIKTDFRTTPPIVYARLKGGVDM